LADDINIPKCSAGPQVVEEKVDTRLLSDDTGEYALTVHWRLEKDEQPYANPNYGVNILADTPAGTIALGVGYPDDEGNVDAIYIQHRDFYDTYSVYLEYNERINSFLQQFKVVDSDIEVAVP